MRAQFALAHKLRLTPGFIDGFAPVLDPTVLPAHPFYPQATRVSEDVPVIIGHNRTEMTLFADPAAFTVDENGMKARVKSIIGDHAEEVDPSLPSRQPQRQSIGAFIPHLDRQSDHDL